MIFDIDRNTDGEWFTYFESRVNDKGGTIYDDPKPDAGKVQIRSIAPILEERLASRKRKFENVFNPHSKSMERIGYYEDLTPEQARKERDDVWDYAIVDWQNITGKNGKEIACTRENKLKLMAIPVFDRFVARCLQMLQDATLMSKEAETKN